MSFGYSSQQIITIILSTPWANGGCSCGAGGLRFELASNAGATTQSHSWDKSLVHGWAQWWPIMTWHERDLALAKYMMHACYHLDDASGHGETLINGMGYIYPGQPLPLGWQ